MNTVERALKEMEELTASLQDATAEELAILEEVYNRILFSE